MAQAAAHLHYVGKFVTVSMANSSEASGIVYTTDPSQGHVVLLRFVSYVRTTRRNLNLSTGR